MAQQFYVKDDKAIYGKINDEFERERAKLDAAFAMLYPSPVIATKNATGNIGADDGWILADSTAGNITLTLPASDSKKKLFVIKKIVTANDVVIQSAGGLIDGGASVTIAAAAGKKALWFKSDGTNYHIVAKFD